jgi:hypothetical protein
MDQETLGRTIGWAGGILGGLIGIVGGVIGTYFSRRAGAPLPSTRVV